MNRKDLLHRFFVEKDYENLKKELVNSDNPAEIEILAGIYLNELAFNESFQLFEKIGKKYEMGRVKLLSGDFKTAKKIWYSVEEDTPVTLWGKSLIQFIEGYVVDLPGFFQIRSFLEVDLDTLLKAGRFDYCENIVNCADLMTRVNTECYKFIARVFVNNDYHDIAKIFLKKAKEICYSDPEVHFLFAKCYIANNNKISAINSLEICLEKAYGYYPAKKLLEQLKLS